MNQIDKEYHGHSTKFSLKTEHIPFPKGYGNESDQDKILDMLKDLRGNLSVRALQNIIQWCLQKIKEYEEENPSGRKFYNETIQKVKEWL